MTIPDFTTMAFWNGLCREHQTEIVMVLTAALVTLVDRYLRKALAKVTASYHVILRFLIFLVACSIGYAALTMGLNLALRHGFATAPAAWLVPAIGGLLVIIAVEAQRQKQV